METIKSSNEITELFTEGTRIKTPYVTFLYRSRSSDGLPANGRIAVIAGKKLGNAVWRNYAKRRMRSLIRDLKGPWLSHDVALIAKSSITTAPYKTILVSCRRALEKAPFHGKETIYES